MESLPEWLVPGGLELEIVAGGRRPDVLLPEGGLAIFEGFGPVIVKVMVGRSQQGLIQPEGGRAAFLVEAAGGLEGQSALGAPLEGSRLLADGVERNLLFGIGRGKWLSPGSRPRKAQIGFDEESPSLRGTPG